MPPARLLHAADLHLGGPVSVRGADALGLASRARSLGLKALVELSKQQSVSLVFLAGDVFHAPEPPLGAVLDLQQACKAWRAMNARVFISPGNHDPWTPGSVWDKWRPMDGVHVFSPEPAGLELEGSGLWVAGAAHSQRHVETDLAALLPQPPEGLAGLAVLHADLPASRNSDEHKPYAPTSLQVLSRSRFLYWALGHWHKPQILSKNPMVVMAGTHQGRGVDEPGPLGAWLVEIDPPAVSARHVSSAPLVFHQAVFDELAQIEDPASLAGLVKGALPRPGRERQTYLSLTLQGPCPLWRDLTGAGQGEAAEALKQNLGLLGLDFNADELGPPVDMESLARQPGLLGHVLRRARAAAGDKEILAGLERALREQLHPLVKSLGRAERLELLREIAPQAAMLAVRDLWRAGDEADEPEGGK